MNEPNEPSVLDYLKSLLFFWRKQRIQIPWEDESAPVVVEGISEERAVEAEVKRVRPRANLLAWPWQLILGLMLALAAQAQLEPPDPRVSTALILYGLAALLVIWAAILARLEIPDSKPDSDLLPALNFRWPLLVVVFIIIFISRWLFAGNQFTYINLFLLLVAIGCVIGALWLPRRTNGSPLRWSWLRSLWSGGDLVLRIRPWSVLMLAVLVFAAYFRFAHLTQVPGEMWSDHAEKLLDVQDVVHGQWSIFFPRNTGREAFQMYLTAFMVKYAGLGISFLSLKAGTALCGLLTLPYIYLLGKEYGNRWVGLFALVLAAMAYWPNVMSRAGLRYTLYPFFTAPTLYYLIRGLRTSNRNDFILGGIALGLGLHGYSSFRIVPFVAAVALGLYLLHAQSKGKRWETVLTFLVLAFVSFLIFLPLLVYMLEDPTMFGYRAFSRLGETERPFPGPVWQIFLDNLWKAWVMPFWKNGNIWVHSIPDRPALDVTSGALYFLGTVMVLVRYTRKRNWADLFLLLSVPLLMMPSILSLAFPEENPSLNRTAGAFVPIFVIAAIGMYGVFAALWKSAGSRFGQGLVVVWALILVSFSAFANYNLVFNKYADQFMAGAWNTSEIGREIKDFADLVGTPDTAYVVPVAHWVDTRLVGINAGFPEKDFALWPEDFNKTLDGVGAKLFIVKAEDTADLQKLKDLYKEGRAVLHQSQRQEKSFWLFLIPAKQ